MALKRKASRRKASITSLIDVIFLLLLFFMLASTFSKEAEIELISGMEGMRTGEETFVVVRLFVAPETLQVDGSPIIEEQLTERLADIIAEPGAIIAVEIGEQVTTQRFVDILLQLRTAPKARIRVVEPS
ncbi:MAG: biopolymer transporter ExbD [Pseudomonadota bacterium]